MNFKILVRKYDVGCPSKFPCKGGLANSYFHLFFVKGFADRHVEKDAVYLFLLQARGLKVCEIASPKTCYP